MMKMLLIYVAVFSLGWLAHSFYNGRKMECEGQYLFVNARFACGDEIVISKKEYSVLKAKLVSYIDDKKRAGQASLVSVYFRDLEAGPTMGIDERVDYIPASLLKLPLALTYYSLGESEVGALDHMLAYEDNGEPLEQRFKSSESLILGESHTQEEIIEKMLVNSDNIASETLYQHLYKVHGIHLFSQTFRDLGILDAGDDIAMAAVSAKGYGSIFRQLYNSSYIGHENSEKLLKLLAQTQFKEGLVAGVPEGVVVAHKFGERFLDNGEKQLHDCGIIYYPQNPYLLCVMTKGHDFNALKEIIRDISREFYIEVDSRKI